MESRDESEKTRDYFALDDDIAEYSADIGEMIGSAEYATGGKSSPRKHAEKNNVIVDDKPAQKYPRSLFIFRRDLRIHDNTALEAACRQSQEVLCVFVFDPAQVSSANKYRSQASINFMIESLRELADDIKSRGSKLLFLSGDSAQTVGKVIRAFDISAVYINADYTPFSVARDIAIAKVCGKSAVKLYSYHDILLLGEPKYNKQDKVYQIFGSFHREFRAAAIDPPSKYTSNNLMSGAKVTSTARKHTGISAVKPEKYQKKIAHDSIVAGGRAEALQLLSAVPRKQAHYNADRNDLAHKTSLLSAHNKFGTVSIREVHEKFRALPAGGRDLIKQLFWRDFYYNLMMNDPNFLKSSFDPRYDRVKWRKSKKDFDAWVAGNTGFPIVDAAMREIAHTHYMHNRARMIVASFLIKTLLLNWRWGEQYFSRILVDYDPAQNFYNWGNVFGNGPYAMAYYRVFNPWSQSKKHDPDAKYIKKWIPELSAIPPADLHKWDESHAKYPDVNYPRPIADYDERKKIFLAEVKRAKK